MRTDVRRSGLHCSDVARYYAMFIRNISHEDVKKIDLGKADAHVDVHHANGVSPGRNTPLVFIIVMAIEPIYEPHRKSEEPLYDELPERRRAALVVADYSDLAFVFLL